jgi:hypothetical protein
MKSFIVCVGQPKFKAHKRGGDSLPLLKVRNLAGQRLTTSGQGI